MATGTDIITEAGILLQDEDAVRWTVPELVLWINQAMRAIVLVKPSACSRTRVLRLDEGTLQIVPAVAGEPEPLALLDVNRNIAVEGPPRVSGRTIRVVSGAMLDSIDPNWHDRRKHKKEVRHAVYDEQTPLEFYVYPGNDGTGLIEAVVAEAPAPLVADPDSDPAVAGSYSSKLALPEPYSVPILEYALSMAFAKDDLAGNSGRSQQHYGRYATAMGIKVQVEGASSPNSRRAAS